MPELAAHRRLQLPEQAWDGTGLVGLEAAAGNPVPATVSRRMEVRAAW